jgi:tRNA pseudouridine38-40 synthase
MRIALSIEYDGSAFCGWQTQPSGCAVQDAVDAALGHIAAEPIRSQCAGRTDAGVHALGQVIHFDTDAVRPETAWVRGVNTYLPDSIAVHWARMVSEAFHARSKAVGRHYTYLLLNRRQRPGVYARHIGWYHRPLDAEAMADAAQMLLGVHDFSAFRAAECQALSPVKHMRRAAIYRSGELVVFEFSADAFLHHMVRNLVGCLVKVGDGSRTREWLAEVLRGRDRRLAAPTFSAHGLYLAAVEYDPAWGLPVPARRMPAIVLSGDVTASVFS